MSLIDTLNTIDGTAKLVQRHHAGLILMFYWNLAVTFAVIALAVRSWRPRS